MNTLDIIGAGRIGRSLAALFAQKNIRIQRVFCRTLQHAQHAVQLIGAGTPIHQFSAIDAPSDALLIATPDDAIAHTCQALVHAKWIQKNSLVWHVSGACSHTELAAAAQIGAHTASTHPIRSFTQTLTPLEAFRNTYVAIEGHPLACTQLIELFSKLDAQPFLLTGDKTVYHAACAIASNFSVVLTHWSEQLTQRAGAHDHAHTFLRLLMQQAIDNTLTMGGQHALTGPIARGDVHTVTHHLSRLSPEQQRAYAALGQLALELAPTPSAQLHALFEHILRPKN